jgi:Na+-driven multidrug efflux pump
MGLQGVAIANIVASAVGTGIFLWYLVTGQGRLTPPLTGVSLNRGMFADILRVGALACLSPVQSVLTTLIFTGLIARLGTEALAGYGIGQRLEFMLIPIAFGIGSPPCPWWAWRSARDRSPRARSVAWTAGVVSAFNLGVVGLIVWAFPEILERPVLQGSRSAGLGPRVPSLGGARRFPCSAWG